MGGSISFFLPSRASCHRMGEKRVHMGKCVPKRDRHLHRVDMLNGDELLKCPKIATDGPFEGTWTLTDSTYSDDLETYCTCQWCGPIPACDDFGSAIPSGPPFLPFLGFGVIHFGGSSIQGGSSIWKKCSKIRGALEISGRSEFRRVCIGVWVVSWLVVRLVRLGQGLILGNRCMAVRPLVTLRAAPGLTFFCTSCLARRWVMLV